MPWAAAAEMKYSASTSTTSTLPLELAGGGARLCRLAFDQGLTVKEPVRFPSFGTARVELADFPDVEVEFVQTRAEKYTDSTRRDPTTVFGSIEGRLPPATSPSTPSTTT